MDDTQAVVDILMRVAAGAEKRNLDSVSARIGSVIREVRAASSRVAGKDSTIEVESWPDFLNWWNNNRGQNLVYIFQDSYGKNSEQVSLVKKLVRDADKHEKDLHELYGKLRDLAGQQLNPEGEVDLEANAPASVPPAEAAPIAEEAEDSALDDIALDL